MKKSIVAGLVLLALVIVVSPGIVGYLAERSVNRQAEWAGGENRELDITSTAFDRGWFSSAGRHRIEFAATPAGQARRAQLGFEPGTGPALIVDTEIDHGLVPIGSLDREEGSLVPGLGNAVSRLSYEAPDGTVVPLPGVVRTRIGLSGAVTSHYTAEAGSLEGVSWGLTDVRVESDARARTLAVDGEVAKLELRAGEDYRFALDALNVSGDLEKTRYGFFVGDMDVAVGSVSQSTGPATGRANDLADDLANDLAGDLANDLANNNNETLGFGPLSLHSESVLDGDAVDSRFAFDLLFRDVPDLGTVALALQGELTHVDAAALGRLVDAVEAMRDEPPGPARQTGFAAVEGDLKSLLAHGLSARIEQLDVTLPQGTMTADVDFDVAASDPDDFVWTGLLLATDARANLKVPAPVFDVIVNRNPDARALVAMGFLVRDGDGYKLAAEFRQGLLTINGAPMPIPIPSM